MPSLIPNPASLLKRLLLVTYYFPPSGGAGVQRTLKYTKYLREHGVEPVVLTVEAGAYPSLDPTLAADVPEGVEVIRTRALDPFGLYGAITGTSRKEAVAVGSVADTGSLGKKLGLWARANVFLPDARVGWVPFALRAARARIARGDVDAVLTSGPPHSAHLVGLGLRRQRRALGLPWIADFRDPWTGITFYDELPMTPLARAFDARLERRVLRSADRVITVSPTWARDLEEQGGLASGAVEVIQNGFDPADFADVDETVREDAFEVAHVGSLYGPRNPEALWAAISALRARGEVPEAPHPPRRPRGRRRGGVAGVARTERDRGPHARRAARRGRPRDGARGAARALHRARPQGRGHPHREALRVPRQRPPRPRARPRRRRRRPAAAARPLAACSSRATTSKEPLARCSGTTARGRRGRQRRGRRQRRSGPLSRRAQAGELARLV